MRDTIADGMMKNHMRTLQYQTNNERGPMLMPLWDLLSPDALMVYAE